MIESNKFEKGVAAVKRKKDVIYIEENEALPKKKTYKGRKAFGLILSLIAIAWNILVIGCVLARGLLFVPALIGGGIFALFGSVMAMLLSLPLAMTSIVMPLIPLGIALLAPALLLLLLLWIASEWVAVFLAVAGLILPVLALAIGKKHWILRSLALVSGIASIGVALLFACLWSACKLLFGVPLLVLGVVSVVFLVQMIVIAIGNAAV